MTGPSAAEAFSSNEEGTSSIFNDCPPVEKKKEQRKWNSNITGPCLPIFFSSSKGIRFAHCEFCTNHLTVSHGGMNDIKHM